MRKVPLEEGMCTNSAVLVVQPFEYLAAVRAGFGERINKKRAGGISEVCNVDCIRVF